MNKSKYVTENAVRIQIYSAICAYCLVAIVQHALIDTMHLRNLFDKTIFKNDKDRSGSSEPN